MTEMTCEWCGEEAQTVWMIDGATLALCQLCAYDTDYMEFCGHAVEQIA